MLQLDTTCHPNIALNKFTTNIYDLINVPDDLFDVFVDKRQQNGDCYNNHYHVRHSFKIFHVSGLFISTK